MGSFGGKFNPSRSSISADMTIKGTTPKLTIGDAGEEDTMLVFDGNAIDYRIGVDDSSDELEIGVGSAHDTTPGIVMNTDGDITKIGVQTQTSGHFLKYDGSKYLLAAVSGEVAGGVAADDINAGDAAINLTTTAGNITIDAQGNNTDIIFKGTDATSDTTFLTIDGSEAGTATFNNDIKLNTDAAVLSFGAGADVTFTHDNGTGMDITSAGNLDIDCTAGSVTLGASLADGQTLKLGKNGAVETIIAPHGTAGSELYSVINTAGTTDGSDAAGSILLSAVAGGIGLAWADDKDLWAEGGQVVLTANHDAAAAIKLHADAGSSQTIQIINDEGTTDGAEAEGAILIESKVGGIGLHGADDKKIWAEAGEVIVTANNNGAAAIKLHADAGANQTIQIINDAGTADGSEGAGAIDIEATVGGISLHGADDKDISIEAGQVVLTANHDTAASIKLHADAGTSQTIQLLNDAGTASTAIDIEATAGGFSIDGVQASNITVASAGDADDLTISVTGANDASLILASAGTGTDAVSIDATAGDMVIAPSLADGKTLKLGKNGAVEMVFTPHGTAGNEKFLLTNTAGTADDAIKLTSVAGGVTIHAGNDSLVIDADGTDADAINIDSAGGIDIDAADEIIITTTSADGHISLVSAHTSGLAFHIDANADAASEVQIDAGVLDIDVTAGTTLNTTGLTITDTTTSSATEGGFIRLVSDDGAAMADDHRLGVIEFAGAEDGSSTITVGAKIEAICDAGWSASENGTALVMSTTDANASQSEVLRLDSDKLATFAGATLFSGNATFGADDTGVDVRIFSATASEGVLYDASEDEFALLLTTKLKFHDVGGGEEIFASANGHLEINAGTTLDVTAPTIDLNASTAVTVDSDTVTFGSANATDPLVTIKNTTNDADGARLRFVKDKGAAGADNDVAGLIEFYADDDNEDNILFAKIEAAVADASNGAEGGKLSLGVATHDGEFQFGLVLTDGNAEDEIDVTIGNGTSSITTIAGVLDLGDRNITNVGDISLDSLSSDGSLVTINAPAEIANGSSGGAAALIIDNDDVDQVALKIEAANTTADALQIICDDSLTTGKALFIDHNDAATTAVSTKTVHLDFDKDGVVGDGVSSGFVLMDLDLNDGATNHANSTVQMVGIDMDIVSANSTGTTQNFGILVNVSGGAQNTAASFTGDVANQTAVGITNDGDNANRYGLNIKAGADDASGVTHYIIAQDGDGDNVGVISNSSGTFSLSDLSDARLKKNIRDTSINGLDIVENIKVRDFELKKNGLSKIGFVAQELKSVYPSAVTGEEDDVDGDGKMMPMAVSFANLVPALVKAVQELSESNKELVARIAELENK
jgi:hypothetical protein